MIAFEEKIGYKFKNKNYLKNALTHSSYANENNCPDNERLEFLGDSVLSLIVTETLFKSHADVCEGDLSKIRALLVCEGGLYKISEKIGLSGYIRLGNGEDHSGGRKRPSVIADAFEALLAAIFLDSDFETAKSWLLKLMQSEIEKTGKSALKDYKTALQEHTQKGTTGKVSYQVVSESGPDHNKQFVCAVLVDNNVIAKGSGSSKKEAEQNAAKKALELL